MVAVTPSLGIEIDCFFPERGPAADEGSAKASPSTTATVMRLTLCTPTW